jgi:signal transduction histidine kinase
LIQQVGQKFLRGTSFYNFDYEGLGLGLYIAQAIVKAHEGVVSFQSRQNQGTVVSIQFPAS